MIGRRLVIVHQENGPTIQGVRVGWRGPGWGWIKLKQAALVEAEGVTVPLEGEARIPRGRVLFCQLVARSG